jgi:CelD/BcsL family acetyltransferase involved in cellulose biosynthesis
LEHQERGTDLRIVSVDPTDDPRWAALVESRPTSVFASPAWCRVLSQTYGFALRANVALAADDAPVAGLAYAEIDDLIGRRIVSLPFSDFCDPIVEDVPTWRRLLEGPSAKQWRIDLRCLENEIPGQDERFEVVDQAGWHGLDLSRSADDTWASIHGSARRAIRKADAAGVKVRVASSEADLRTFYDLHLRTRKYKYRLLAQPYRFFESIWEQFLAPGNGFLLLAELDGEPAGSILFLEWQERLYYKFSASHASSLTVRPNDKLTWEGIRMGMERGLKLLDFGLSDLGQEGLVRYKQKYATTEKRIKLLRLAPAGWPDDREVNARAVLGKLTGLLVDEEVPDDITAQAGDVMYRFFS